VATVISMTKHAFIVRVNDGPPQEIVVSTGIYEYAAAAVPALLGADELPIDVTISSQFREFRFRLCIDEFGRMQVEHLVRAQEHPMVDLDELRSEGGIAIARDMRLGHYAHEAADEIERLRAERGRLRMALKDCADDLESELNGRYTGMKDHPAMKSRYDRDMPSVLVARNLLGDPEQKAP
jgi:hypothetical protein